MLAAPAMAQTRPIRLFFSSIGLSDPGNTDSPALAPLDAVGPASGGGANIKVPGQIGVPVRLYMWAQIMGNNGGAPSNPRTVVYQAISLRVRATGAGATITGMNFWNYSPGTPVAFGGGYGRWRSGDIDGSGGTGHLTLGANEVGAGGAAVNGGVGVRNAIVGDATSDLQYMNLVGGIRQDVTLLGSVDVMGSAAGKIELRYSVGTQGINRSGAGPEPVYTGYGDEGVPLTGASANAGRYDLNPTPDASINVVPEPASLALLALAGLAALRRR